MRNRLGTLLVNDSQSEGWVAEIQRHKVQAEEHELSVRDQLTASRGEQSIEVQVEKKKALLAAVEAVLVKIDLELKAL